eukprot:gnl/TRDRNA2_/TRDRNA2_201932_c0_seq1.p1 gnl/TRDRNA2_/TRDRNA2_201932_c0~~gnl/TRDRNA2_/TRDRNA2_201932_c0_seq1.p1  ORF type:complete len:460 (+),score=72.39 gnl/TRDRNA2_/TRDRNA2_201932_c0_seq1:83-1462(+)
MSATQHGTYTTYQKFWRQWYESRFTGGYGGGTAGPPQTALLDGRLFLSPVGIGTHRMDDGRGCMQSLLAAMQRGVNVVDTAPNYGDGGAERAIGKALGTLMGAGVVARDSMVIVSKVGNVVGEENIARCKELCAVRDGSGLALPQRKDGSIYHCISPEWIDAEISGSLQRLDVECIDVLLLHNPETVLGLREASWSSAAAVTDDMFYEEMLKSAFAELEIQVSRGRIQYYGVTGAFYPLRASEPQHMLLERVLKVAGPHFRVVQFPLNFAEPEALTRPQVARKPDGGAVNRDAVIDALSLADLARKHGLYMLTNRPLNGIYRELRGVCRFTSSLSMNSELQGEDVDMLEYKLSRKLRLPPPDEDEEDEGVTGQLSGKTILVLTALRLGTVLVGMHTEDYIQDVWSVLFDFRFAVKAEETETARDTVVSLHQSLSMWFSMAQDDDRGTAKDWRLPQRSNL